MVMISVDHHSSWVAMFDTDHGSTWMVMIDTDHGSSNNVQTIMIDHELSNKHSWIMNICNKTICFNNCMWHPGKPGYSWILTE